MATALAIMDRPGLEARTDVIVVADPERRRLLWIPRDLWCECVDDRINEAFRLGGEELLFAALAEHGIEVEHAICLGREIVERGLEDLSVMLPIREPLEFWYPLHPQQAIEDGRKRIRFDPPVERLDGERVHQWIGARYAIEIPGRKMPPFPDLARIRRQQELAAVMLGDGFDFGVFDLPDSGGAGRRELALVDASWTMDIFGPVAPAEIRGMKVLVPAA